jgi:hypothetical protein
MLMWEHVSNIFLSGVNNRGPLFIQLQLHCYGLW